MEIAAASGLGTTLLGNLMVADRPLATPAVFSALDLRVSRPFGWRSLRFEPILEVFNVFNTTSVSA
jgi:hypothetical protein